MTLALVVILLLVFAVPASAREAGCIDICSRAAPRPVARPVIRPAPRPAPRPTPRPAPQPAAAASALGLHRVTQVFTGHSVTRSGPVTTYSSQTVQQNAGTYAKQVASVASGQRSAYDSVLSNGRTTMSNGRAVAGDIYANYVWTGATMRLDRYVFFQSDREVARTLAPAPAPFVVPAPARTPAPVATPRPVQYAAPVATPRQAATPRPTPSPRTVRSGVALTSQGDLLARIEVLRGRRVELWPRATADGSPARVLMWRLVSGEVTALGPVSGTDSSPLDARWDTVQRDAAPFDLRFSVTVEVPGEPPRTVETGIAVVVRSPALIE